MNTLKVMTTRMLANLALRYCGRVNSGTQNTNSNVNVNVNVNANNANVIANANANSNASTPACSDPQPYGNQ
jgi:hypothetical protein